ncbi:EthD domain-containing protein [Alteribacillus sp. YIM 98480]|uniref:EthD domain-containing protein n=1 Tax=Alteribacillus sp. YIM 98480 TaxID=2606599 RepID=UPI00131BB311|nr:EthD domain-containing protein [Alteribacillus sp. YIM 98480]
MLKMTFCVKKLSHLSRQEFNQYWHETHASLVHKHALALRIKKYTQIPVLEDANEQESIRSPRGAVSAPFDGVAELWWESLEDLKESRRSPEGKKAAKELLEDERRFIDLSNSSLWYGEEREIFSYLDF